MMVLRYAEGVDTGHIISTPSALFCLAKTGILNGKLLFLLYPEHLDVLDTIYESGLPTCYCLRPSSKGKALVALYPLHQHKVGGEGGAALEP